jgi:hypothetical protein
MQCNAPPHVLQLGKNNFNIILPFRHTLVGVVTGYGLDNREVEIPVSVGSIIFSLHVVHTDCGAQPASYPMGTWGSFPEGKRVGS